MHAINRANGKNTMLYANLLKDKSHKIVGNNLTAGFMSAHDGIKDQFKIIIIIVIDYNCW